MVAISTSNEFVLFLEQPAHRLFNVKYGDLRLYECKYNFTAVLQNNRPKEEWKSGIQIFQIRDDLGPVSKTFPIDFIFQVLRTNRFFV